MEVIKEKTEHKLQVVNLGYTTGCIMKEELITFTILYGLPNDSIRVSHHTHREFCTGCYHIVLFTDVFHLLVEQTCIIKNTFPNKPPLALYLILHYYTKSLCFTYLYR